MALLLKAPHFENSGIWQGKEGSIGETKHMRSEVEPHLQMHTHAKFEGSVRRQCPVQSPGTPCLYLNMGSQAMPGTHSKKQCLSKNKLYLLEELLSSSGIPSAVVHKCI